MEEEHVVGDTDRGTRKKNVNQNAKEREKNLRYV